MGEILFKSKSFGPTRAGQTLAAFYLCVPLYLVLDMDVVMEGM